MGSEAFDKLADFITHKMRMSHIYQPVMMTEMLLNGGTRSVKEIAKAFLQRDESQVEYYSQITNAMPGRVLGKNHGLVEKHDDGYRLLGYEDLTEDQVNALVEMCQHRLTEYIEQRGNRIWQHRGKPSGYISGTLKYEVLKRARFRCELCGISANERALQVDHIVPRNLHGPDDISNLQSLCYQCNAMKRDRDDTDLRGIAASYGDREEGCPFCDIDEGRIIDQNTLAVAIHDAYPVTELHTLVLPRRHVADYYELGRPEVNACNQLLEDAKKRIQEADSGVTGFNIGVNIGEDAGQTILHCHVHLIPRRAGDTPKPRGGVRGVIPSKQDYPAKEGR